MNEISAQKNDYEKRKQTMCVNTFEPFIWPQKQNQNQNHKKNENKNLSRS